MWKRADNQMESAKLLLEEMGEDADIFNVDCAPGVTAIAWGNKRIATCLEGKIVEVAIDATCKPFTYDRIRFK